ncbi:MAG: zinc dependent phospholipase C family protein [Anaerolineales bacterium]
MPTPFNHIVLAERVLAHPALPHTAGTALRDSRAAFLLGNTAPDLGNVTGAARTSTHFFDVPMKTERPAYLRMFERHSSLSDGSKLQADHAAFIAGYAAHLWLDQAWIAMVFEPIYGLRVRRATFRQRLLDHNLLRAHLDRLDRHDLPDDLDVQLGRARPNHWLPFASDEDIQRWRDHLLEQVRPGGHTRTVEVFAAKSGVPQRQFALELDSKETLQSRVLGPLPTGLIDRFWRVGLENSVRIVAAYTLGELRVDTGSAKGIPSFNELANEGIGERP